MILEAHYFNLLGGIQDRLCIASIVGPESRLCHCRTIESVKGRACSSVGVKKSPAGVRACICRTYPIFTPDKVIAYAERIRFTPNDLLLVYRRINNLVYTNLLSICLAYTIKI